MSRRIAVTKRGWAGKGLGRIVLTGLMTLSLFCVPGLTARADEPVFDADGIYTAQDGTQTYQPADLAADGWYEIGNAGQLAWLAQVLDDTSQFNDYKGQKYRLTGNIDLSSVCYPADAASGVEEKCWQKLSPYSYAFEGTFDGNNHTVSNLYIRDANGRTGLFSYLGQNGTIKNLTVSGSIQSLSEIGGICGISQGTIENCTNQVEINGSSTIGGICGNNAGTIKDCTNLEKISGTDTIGGICGNNTGTVRDCMNQGMVKGSSSTVGGILGTTGGTVLNCSNSAAVTGQGTVGGISGSFGTGVIEKCVNEGTVTSSGGRQVAGGICGSIDTGSLLNCYNIGKVSGYKYIAGICGRTGGKGGISHCYSTGIIMSENAPCCGICASNSGNAEVTNCYYVKTGKITAGVAGGSAGKTAELTQEQFASGEAAWLLSGGEERTNPDVWYQTLDEEPRDELPLLIGSNAVYHYVNCRAEEIYNNISENSEHAWTFTVTGNGAAITAACQNEPTAAVADEHTATLTLAAPADLVYSGSAKAATLSDADGKWKTYFGSLPTVSYSYPNQAPSNVAPVNAGDVTAQISFTYDGVTYTASIAYTIEKRGSRRL